MSIKINTQHKNSFDQLPAELKQIPQWCVNGLDSKGTYKVPCIAGTNKLASVSDSNTWSDFVTAKNTESHGLGFVLTDSDPYTVIDLDVKNSVNFPNNPEIWTTQEQLKRFEAILKAFDSYTERSSSGQGLHIWVKGVIGSGCKRDGVEVYSRQRFMVCTGDALWPNKPIAERQDLLDQLVTEIRRINTPLIEYVDLKETLTDSELLNQIMAASNSNKFNSLWAGDWQELGYPSQSEADFALLNMFAFYSKNNEQCKRLFRESTLGKREKSTKNDYYLDRTLKVIRSDQLSKAEEIEVGKMVAETLLSNYSAESNSNKGNQWIEPLPLIEKIAPQKYPVEALPPVIKAAVQEVIGFTKAPVALAAASSLSSLSIAIQGLVDVERDEKLTGITSLFLLTIADSGERKSTCDNYFTTPIREYEAEQIEQSKPYIKTYETALETWNAKRSGIMDAIRLNSKNGNDSSEQTQYLEELDKTKPIPPKSTCMFYADATPEAIAFGLANVWPSGGIVSAEAGVVFGSHGMGKDSIMRNLAMLNTLWDGSPLSIHRRTSESYTVRGVRLTVGLQIQEATLRSFFDQAKGLPRGTGFLARFLIAWPESTQGTRLYNPPPKSWPNLTAFHNRLKALLNIKLEQNDLGELMPKMLTMSTQAKRLWIDFHDRVESQLASGRRFSDVRDVASKAADNVARLAALFHIFEGNSSLQIESESIQSATLIVEWYLYESLRFFGELAQPNDVANATCLDRWIIEYCKREKVDKISRQKLSQSAPSQLRGKILLQETIKTLVEHGRVRWIQEGRAKTLQVNPILLQQT